MDGCKDDVEEGRDENIEEGKGGFVISGSEDESHKWISNNWMRRLALAMIPRR